MQLIDWPAVLHLLDPSPVVLSRRLRRREARDLENARKRALRSGNPAVRAAAKADR